MGITEIEKKIKELEEKLANLSQQVKPKNTSEEKAD